MLSASEDIIVNDCWKTNHFNKFFADMSALDDSSDTLSQDIDPINELENCTRRAQTSARAEGP